MKKIIATALLFSSGLALAEGLESPTKSDAWYARHQLTGDWMGARETLAENGVDLFAYYDAIAAANVSGGLHSDEAYAGQVYLGAKLDLEKLIGLDGTTFLISTVNRHGESVSDSVGGMYDPMCIYGGQVTYLYQLWLEKTFGDDWAVKFGRVSADSDFANNDLYRYSLSTAINGPIRALLLENAITSFPYAVWGGRVKYNPSETHQFQFGAYQIGEDMWDYKDRGLDFSIRSDDGVSFLAQYDWTPQVFDRPARVFVGLVNSFYDFDDYDGTGTTDHFTRGYGHADVEIADGVTVFGTMSYTAQDKVAKTPLQTSLGLNCKGLISSRPDDHTMLFATYGQLSDAYGDSVGEDVDYEIVYEVGHRVQLTPATYVQPSIQYVQNPGGTGDIDDAVVLGAWIGLSF